MSIASMPSPCFVVEVCHQAYRLREVKVENIQSVPCSLDPNQQLSLVIKDTQLVVFQHDLAATFLELTQTYDVIG